MAKQRQVSDVVKVLRPYSAAMEEVNAANPEAEEANPAAVGKLLYDAT